LFLHPSFTSGPSHNFWAQALRLISGYIKTSTICPEFLPLALDEVFKIPLLGPGRFAYKAGTAEAN